MAAFRGPLDPLTGARSIRGMRSLPPILWPAARQAEAAAPMQRIRPHPRPIDLFLSGGSAGFIQRE